MPIVLQRHQNAAGEKQSKQNQHKSEKGDKDDEDGDEVTSDDETMQRPVRPPQHPILV